VGRTALYILLILTAARTSSTWNAMILSYGSTATGAILTTSGMLATSGSSAFPATLFISPRLASARRLLFIGKKF